MEAKRIEMVKEWPEPKSIQDIKVFLGFANFYWQFIQGFSRMAAPLILILKTTIPPERSTLERLGVGNNEVNGFGDGGNGVEHTKKLGKLSKSGKLKSEKTFKSWNSAKSGKKLSKSGNSTNFNAIKDGPKFLTPNTRIAFNHLWLAFTEALILWLFDPECHIQIKTDALGYAIGRVLNQLTSGTSSNGIVIKTNLSQWHPLAFFLRKMIPAETWYKTHNGKLLAIVKVFKTWRHYLEGYKHEVLVLTDYNNLRCFMDMKSLCFQQVH